MWQSGLRNQCCHGSGSSCYDSTGLTPGQGTSTCPPPKKKPQTNKLPQDTTAENNKHLLSLSVCGSVIREGLAKQFQLRVFQEVAAVNCSHLQAQPERICFKLTHTGLSAGLSQGRWLHPEQVVKENEREHPKWKLWSLYQQIIKTAVSLPLLYSVLQK